MKTYNKTIYIEQRVGGGISRLYHSNCNFRDDSITFQEDGIDINIPVRLVIRLHDIIKYCAENKEKIDFEEYRKEVLRNKNYE